MEKFIKELIDQEISIIDKQDDFKNKEIKSLDYIFWVNRIIDKEMSTDLWNRDTWDSIFNQIGNSYIKDYLGYKYFIINLGKNQYLIGIISDKYKYIIAYRPLINK